MSLPQLIYVLIAFLWWKCCYASHYIPLQIDINHFCVTFHVACTILGFFIPYFRFACVNIDKFVGLTQAMKKFFQGDDVEAFVFNSNWVQVKEVTKVKVTCHIIKRFVQCRLLKIMNQWILWEKQIIIEWWIHITEGIWINNNSGRLTYLRLIIYTQ